MSKKKGKARRGAQVGTFAGCLRHFLTAAVFKQGHQAHQEHQRQRRCRWQLHPLILTLALFTWCSGDSLEERFQVARTFYVDVLAPKRRRPGETVEGFNAALARLPMRVLRVVTAGVRQLLLLRLSAWLKVDGFLPFGCDGSRLCCPRAEELEKRLGTGGKAGGAPQAWITAVVHLSTGLLWSWRIGKANASEREHLEHLLPTLPKGSLLVTDAGYQGADLTRAMLRAGVDFLIRVSSHSTLYAAVVPAEGWSDGVVMLWTAEDQRHKRPPLLLRLIRLRSPNRKVDVWMLTNVLQPGRLSAEAAGRFYKMRWENEGFFRTYKRTLNKVKLSSRTVALIHREVEGSLLAVQLLLSQGVWARAALQAKDVRCSPRRVLLEIRREIREAHKRRGRQGYRRRLGQAGREDRQRRRPKMKRQWPSRVDHKPPKPPKLRTLPNDLIAKLHKLLGIP
jgi:Transposase DDE domain